MISVRFQCNTVQSLLSFGNPLWTCSEVESNQFYSMVAPRNSAKEGCYFVRIYSLPAATPTSSKCNGKTILLRFPSTFLHLSNQQLTCERNFLSGKPDFYLPDLIRRLGGNTSLFARMPIKCPFTQTTFIWHWHSLRHIRSHYFSNCRNHSQGPRSLCCALIWRCLQRLGSIFRKFPYHFDRESSLHLPRWVQAGADFSGCLGVQTMEMVSEWAQQM